MQLYTFTITVFIYLSLNILQIDDEAISKEKVYRILLERRSLLILQEKMYDEYMHGIDEIANDTIENSITNLKCCMSLNKNESILSRNKRISLTIRNVPKVSKLNLNSLVKKK